ncbi:hypothetical protein HNQ85_001801 [Anoxybacillus calidus]|jgi:Arm DNA-binding domain|uniref:AP2-like integrase N-terminal domain-containing protein n=1 Tax=[Anoxybacillus] calidus TaxID=575178 RepID=A0A7V9YZZ7_9BACL|nr:Arm DNA-binding domain-containing protein [Anoxybacillus calidus]MBA2871531.1 hypothetical protein [Anoxybacillus calidus]
MLKLDVGIGPSTGKRKTTTKRRFRTKIEAQLATAKLECELANGVYMKVYMKAYMKKNDRLLVCKRGFA